MKTCKRCKIAEVHSPWSCYCKPCSIESAKEVSRRSVSKFYQTDKGKKYRSDYVKKNNFKGQKKYSKTPKGKEAQRKTWKTYYNNNKERLSNYYRARYLKRKLNKQNENRK